MNPIRRERLSITNVSAVPIPLNFIRLMLDGGAPWETLRVESTIYGIMHGDAPLSHRIFRFATMIPSLFLPPKWFYASRSWIGERTWYKRNRKRFLPTPKVTSVAEAEEFNA